jgi:hypothetical protein
MSKSMQHRIPLAVSLAAAIALSVSACGSVTLLGSGPDRSSAASSTNGTPPAPASTSGQGGFTTGTSGTASGFGGQSGTTGGASGSSAGGSSGQVGVAGGANGASGGTPGVSTPASGLSPDEVAQYCKYFNNLYSPGVYENIEYQAAEPLRQLRTHTPVQLQQYVDILATDYNLVAKKTRTNGQVRDEIDAAYQSLSDFHDQICN